MTVLFTEGFDSYTTIDESGKGKWTNSGHPTYYSLVPGRFGGQAIELNGSNTGVSNQRIAFGAEAELIIAMAINITVPPLGSADTLFSLFDDDDTQIIVTVNKDGKLDIRNGTFAIDSTVTVPLQVWFSLELKVKFSKTVGTIDVIVDGVQKLSLTNIDTVGDFGGDVANILQLGTYAGTAIIDDFYILNTLGTINNAFLGDKCIETIRPVSDDVVAWTAQGGGSNFVEVNEILNNLDVNYVLSSTSSARDTYNFEQLSDSASVVDAVVVHNVSRQETAGSRSVRNISLSGANTIISATQPVGSDYRIMYNIYETDDGNLNIWTPALVNSVKLGMELF